MWRLRKESKRFLTICNLIFTGDFLIFWMQLICAKFKIWTTNYRMRILLKRKGLFFRFPQKKRAKIISSTYDPKPALICDHIHWKKISTFIKDNLIKDITFSETQSNRQSSPTLSLHLWCQDYAVQLQVCNG